MTLLKGEAASPFNASHAQLTGVRHRSEAAAKARGEAIDCWISTHLARNRQMRFQRPDGDHRPVKAV